MICLLIMSLEAVESECTFETFNAQFKKKASNKGKKGNKCPSTESTTRVSKKLCTVKHCNFCKKHGGAYTTHNTKECGKYKKDGIEKYNICTAKKSRKKPNPARHSFMQFSQKLDKLEKAIKKQGTKGRGGTSKISCLVK
jgi:hypothetical protein